MMSNIVPIHRNSKDKQNLHIISASVAANKCIRELVKRGFTVLAIEILGNPVVTIQHCPQCDDLGGFCHKRSNGFEGTAREYIADLLGCTVVWDQHP